MSTTGSDITRKRAGREAIFDPWAGVPTIDVLKTRDQDVPVAVSFSAAREVARRGGRRRRPVSPPVVLGPQRGEGWAE